MQKVINTLAIISFGVSSIVVAGGVYIYLEKDNLIESAKTQVTDSIKELLGTSQLGSTLIEGVGGESGVTDIDLDANTSSPVPLPVVPFGG